MTSPYSLRSIGSFMAGYKWRFIAVIFSFVIGHLFLAIIPILIGKLVGSLAANPINRDDAYLYAGLLIGSNLGHTITWHASEFLYMKLLQPLGYIYENIVFRHVIRRPYPYFVDKFTGKLSAYVDTLGLELRNLIENISFNYTAVIVRLLTLGFILSSVNWYTGALFFATILLMVMVGKKTVRNSIRYEKVFADVQSTKTGKIVDAVANFVNVKSFQKEPDEISSIEAEQNKTIAAARQSFLWNMFFWGSMGLVVRILFWPTVIILNVYLFLNNRLDVAGLTTLLSAIFLFSEFVWEIIWYVSQFNIKLARVEEAHTYLFGHKNIVKDRSDDKHALEPRKLENALTLNHLSFAYPDNHEVEVLCDMNLQIRKGQKIGVVGKSGSGKTTLTKLLLNYYSDYGGDLLLDGKIVSTTELSRLIAYVPQDTTLFHRSIADNIAYAVDGTPSKEDIIKAARQAHADEFISKLDQSYDAIVGERGVKLSAGQRQRIAIARAFLDDKPILILDEATSALDSESEVLVQEALEDLWQDKTVIAIAHRLSTLRHMDKIIVLDHGRIIEQGTHAELLAQNRKYSELWSHQSGGFLED